MNFVKKNLFTTTVLLFMLLSAALCISTVWYYSKTSSSPVSQHIGFNGIKETEKPGNAGAGRNDRNVIHPPSANNAQGPNASTNVNNNNSANFHMTGRTSSSAAKYSPVFFVYAIAFFGMCAAAFYFFMKKKLKINVSNVKLLMFGLLATGLFLRITLALYIEGYQGDISLFRNWAASVSSNFSQFYSGSRSSDYPPVYIYVLYIVGKIASVGSFNKFYILLLKLPSIFADIAASYLLYKLAKKYLSQELSLLLSAFYIFNPAIFINSAMWGQVDSFFTLLVIISLYLLCEKKLYPSASMFTLAVLMKPQGIIFLPVLFFELVRQKSIKKIIVTTIVVTITVLIVVLPFAYNKEALWIFKLYSGTVSEYPYASLNAFNFFSLIGANYAKDSSTLFFISYKAFGLICIILTTLFSWYLYYKADDSKFAPAAALIQIAGVFTFSVGMHERYLFPAVALAALSYVYIKDKRILLIMLGYSYTSYVNMHTVLFASNKGSMGTIAYNPTLFVTSLLNIILFIYLARVMFEPKGMFNIHT